MCVQVLLEFGYILSRLLYPVSLLLGIYFLQTVVIYMN